MWHPVQDAAYAWKSAATGWGKVSVATFYFICWSTVLVNVPSLFHPLKYEAYGCPVAVIQPTYLISTYVVLLLRLWILTVMFFFGMTLLSGWTLFSTGVLVIYWIAIYVIQFALFTGLHDNDDLACLNQFWQPVGHIVSVFVVLAYVFKWADEWTKSRSSQSTTERTPLSNAK